MPDWRETLFVWRGILTFKKNEPPLDEKLFLKWSGSWLPMLKSDKAEDVLNDNSFSASLNEFCLETTYNPNKCIHDYVEWNWESGHYSLDNGLGYEKFTDFQHTIRIWIPKDTQALMSQGADIFSLTSGSAAVACWGHNEFGTFTSAGYLTRTKESNDLCLTIARRYIEDHDPRCGVRSLQDVEPFLIKSEDVNMIGKIYSSEQFLSH